MDDYSKEVEAEKICDNCGAEMKFTKKPKKNRWSKESSYYTCECGNKFRKRTRNEILRDLGYENI